MYIESPHGEQLAAIHRLAEFMLQELRPQATMTFIDVGLKISQCLKLPTIYLMTPKPTSA